MRRIKIFDTTLRDGEQSPGASLTTQEKVMIARQLERLNVDVIEAGFPISSRGSFDAVKQISEEVKRPVICALARSLPKDIDAAWDALNKAERSRIHVFIATSQIHLEYKLRKSKEDVMKMARGGVKKARSYCEDIEFSPEDASRTDMDYMCSVIEEAVSAGATTINIPDTVGYAQPEEFGERIRYVLENVSNIKGIDISAHCHDDLGLSVANSLAAIRSGATQVEGTINGIGERAGNTALEEVIMALKLRQDHYKAYTGVDTKQIFRTSQLVQKLTGLSVQRNKSIVGKNAFAHESGIHQHGVISNRKTYEIMSPEDVGWEGENIVIGKLSGKHAIEDVLKRSGISLDKEQMEAVVSRLKDLADKEKEVERDDVVAIAIDVLNSDEEEIVSLSELSVLSGNRITPSSTVGLRIDGKEKIGTAVGVGPIDAAAKAISNLIGPFIDLKEYSLKAITGGTDALAQVAIKFEDDKKNIFASEGVDEDVIMASVKAMIKGANKAMVFRKTKGDQNQRQ